MPREDDLSDSVDDLGDAADDLLTDEDPSSIDVTMYSRRKKLYSIVIRYKSNATSHSRVSVKRGEYLRAK